MELKNLFEPIIFGKNEDEKDLISVPSNQDIKKYNLTNNDLVLDSNNADFWWLRNDQSQAPKIITAENHNVRYYDGCIYNKDGSQQKIEERKNTNNPLGYTYELDLNPIYKNIFGHGIFNYCNFAVRPMMQINLQAYHHLKKYFGYQPYEILKKDKSYYCVNLGKQFNLATNEKGNQKLVWRILNWEDMPVNINPQGTGKAESMALLSMQDVGALTFSYQCENLATSWANSAIRNRLNGKCKKHESFIDNAFEDERMLLRTFRRKKTKVIETNQSALKKQLITELQNNPQDWADLIPYMKNYIATMEKEK